MTKEIRALLPIWAGGALITAAARFAWPTGAHMLYAFASVVLSAMSVGHEYTYGTLTSLLTVPISRRRHLLNKLSALVPMLVSLALLAMLVLPDDPMFDRDISLPRLSLLFAVLAAPLFTMLLRSPIGGAAFAVGFAGSLQSVSSTGWHQWVLTVASAASAIGGVWLFLRLEVIEGRSISLDLPAWNGAAASARAGTSSPMWLLIQKELRLQQMAFVTTAAYLLMWVVAHVAWWGVRDVHDVLPTLGVVYGAMLAILIGALAGAEERHMQTLESQLLLPVAVWKQWAVKVLVATVVTLALSVVLPTLMSGGDVGFNMTVTALVIIFTIGSLYVATLCDSTVGAVVIASPLMLLLVAVGFSYFAPAIGGRIQPGPLRVAILIMLVMALWFGYRNYVNAGRELGRVAWQAVSMLVVVAVVGSMYYVGQLPF